MKVESNSKPIILLFEDSSPNSFSLGLQQLEDEGCKSAIIFFASSDISDLESYNRSLQQSPLRIYGGVFPRLLYNKQCYNDGVLMIGVAEALEGFSCEQISDELSCRQAFSDEEQMVTLREKRNYLLIVDGLSNFNERFIDLAYEHLGSGNQYIGGGAGYIDFQQRECIITNRGITKDAAVIAALPWDLNLTMSHGLEAISGPYLATETDGCLIKTINYLPAYEVYKSEIANSGEPRSLAEDFQGVAVEYPIGLPGIDNEIIVREAISTDGAAITCVGKVLQNSRIYLLRGTKRDLIKAVKDVLDENEGDQNYALVFNCIGRALYMGDEINCELSDIESVLTSGGASFGVFSVGEIITGKSGAINWLNKSTSIARFRVDA